MHDHEELGCAPPCSWLECTEHPNCDVTPESMLREADGNPDRLQEIWIEHGYWQRPSQPTTEDQERWADFASRFLGFMGEGSAS